MLALLVIPLAGIGIIGSVAFAASQPQGRAQQQMVQTQADAQDQNDSNLSEAQESQTLQSKATISADQARKTAEAKVGGTASSVTLGDEDGKVIYEVIVNGQEVKVDAKTGSVLTLEKQGSEVHDNQNKSKDGDKETLDDANGVDQETAD